MTYRFKLMIERSEPITNRFQLTIYRFDLMTYRSALMTYRFDLNAYRFDLITYRFELGLLHGKLRLELVVEVVHGRRLPLSVEVALL